MNNFQVTQRLVNKQTIELARRLEINALQMTVNASVLISDQRLFLLRKNSHLSRIKYSRHFECREKSDFALLKKTDFSPEVTVLGIGVPNALFTNHECIR